MEEAVIEIPFETHFDELLEKCSYEQLLYMEKEIAIEREFRNYSERRLRQLRKMMKQAKSEIYSEEQSEEILDESTICASEEKPKKKRKPKRK